MARLTVFFIFLFSAGCAVKAPVPSEGQSTATPKSEGFFEPANTASTNLISNARDMIANENVVDAIVLLERALRLDPQNGYTWLVLAEAELSRMGFIRAEQFARKAVLFLSKMDQIQAWRTIANALDGRGNKSAARSIRELHNIR
jgi:Tfp pilus assembly protein PilF